MFEHNPASNLSRWTPITDTHSLWIPAISNVVVATESNVEYVSETLRVEPLICVRISRCCIVVVGTKLCFQASWPHESSVSQISEGALPNISLAISSNP